MLPLDVFQGLRAGNQPAREQGGNPLAVLSTVSQSKQTTLLLLLHNFHRVQSPETV